MKTGYLTESGKSPAGGEEQRAVDNLLISGVVQDISDKMRSELRISALIKEK